MKSRTTVPILVVMLLVVGGLWLERSHGTTTQAENGQPPSRPDPKKKRQKGAAEVNLGAGSLAFDVEKKSHRATSRYMLEITHTSGQVTTHDLKKPKWRRGTIAVPLPVLAPGNYQVVVIAEGPGGKSRSRPLEVKLQ
jgi:hypothetical protein